MIHLFYLLLILFFMNIEKTFSSLTLNKNAPNLLKNENLNIINKKNIPSDVKHFVAGFSAGIGEWMFGHPFDTIKVRIMADAASKSTTVAGEAARLSMRQSGLMDFAIPRGGTGRSPVKLHETFISLYRGSVSELCASAFGSSLLFGVNNFMRKVFKVKDTTKDGVSLGFVLAAGGTGLVDAVVYKPLEFMKIQMQTGCQYTHRSFRQSIVDQYTRGGIKVFYKGVEAAIMRDVLGNAAFFSIYHSASNYFNKCINEKRDLMTRKRRKQLQTVSVLVAGAVAGICYEMISFPFEGIAVLMQLSTSSTASANSPAFKNMWSCMKYKLKDGGVPALYHGITPALVRALPSYSASFYAYESALKYMNEQSPANPVE